MRKIDEKETQNKTKIKTKKTKSEKKNGGQKGEIRWD